MPKPRDGKPMKSGPFVTCSQQRYGGSRHVGRAYRM